MAIDLQAPVDLGVVAAAARRAVRWWLGELAALVPQVWRDRLSTPSTRIDAEAGSWTIRRPGFEAQTQPNLDGLRALAADLADAPCEIRLSKEATLERRLTLPAKTFGRLAEAVELQIERISPLPLARTQWSARTFRDEQGARYAACVVADAERVRGIANTVRDAGLKRFRICDATGRFNLHDEDQGRTLRRALVAGLVALGLLLIAGAVVWDFWRASAVTAELEEKIAALRVEAEAVATIRREVQAETALGATISARLERPAPLTLLAEVTRIVPDDAWLNAFEVDGKRITLQGFGRNPAAVLSAVAASPLFGEAVFDGTLQRQIELGADRFVLRAALRGVTP